MAEHTPGPWFVDDKRGFPMPIEQKDGLEICRVGGNALCIDDPEEAEANARLIAVAPRLLMHARGAWHLCQSMLATRDGATDDLIRELADALQADIAAAEG